MSASESLSGPAGMQQAAVKSFGWAALAFGGNRFIVFLGTLALARLIAPEDFGVVAAALALIVYFEIGLDMGVGAALVYEQEQGITRRVQAAFTLNVLMSAAFTAVLVAAAPLVAAFFQSPDATDVFRALAFFLLIRGAGQVQDAVLKRDLDFRKRTVVQLARAVVRTAVSVALALAGYGAWALVWGMLSGELVGTALTWLLVRFKPALVLDAKAVRSLLSFGGTVLALRLVDQVAANVDYLVVGNQLGPTDLGYYTLAYRLPELLILNVCWIFSTVAFPVYAKARSEGPAAFKQAMLRALRLTTFYGFVVGTGLALVSRDAVHVLFSPRWGPSAMPMLLISLAVGLGAIGYASGDIFPAVGRPGLLLKLSVPVTFVTVVALVAAAPYGLVAIAAVHVVVSAMDALVRIVIANRFVGATTRESLRAMRPAVVTAGMVAAAALPARILLPEGPVALAVIIASGLIGGLIGLLVGGRDLVTEIGQLARLARARP